MSLKETYTPQGAIGNESAEWLASKSHIGDVIPHRKRVPVLNLPQMKTTASVLESLSAGNPVLTELSTFGSGGLLFASAGDKHVLKWTIPDSMDRALPLGIELEWCEPAGASGTVTWLGTHLAVVPGTTAIAAPATALDTQFTALQASGTQYVSTLSSEGIILGGTIPAGARSLLIGVEADALATITASLLEVWVSYYRKYSD